MQEDIEKRTLLLESIPADVKLAAAILYMVTTKTNIESQYDFRVDQSTYSLFISKVHDAFLAQKIFITYMKIYALKLKFLVKYFLQLLLQNFFIKN